MSALRLTATGRLEVTPLPNLLAYVLDRKLTGTLVVEDPLGNKSALAFGRGYPIKACTADSVILVGSVLVKLGLLAPAVAESIAQQAMGNGCLFGDHLVATATLPRDRVEDALREQSRHRIRWMFSLPAESSYGFYEGDLLRGWGGPEGVPVPVLPLVWHGIRAHASDARVQSVLARLGDRPLRLHVDAKLERFDFEGHEQAMVEVLQAKPQSVEWLVATGLVPEPIAQRIIYMLAITRDLDLGMGNRPIGVEEPSAHGGSRRSMLTDPERRRRYDQPLEWGTGNSEQEKIARVLRAANAYQRARILLKTNKLDAAEQEARAAAEDDPEQPEYLALWAWIQANQPERLRTRRYDDVIVLLNRAVRQDPYNESARYWRGEVLKRAGQLEQAMRDFRWVRHHNPHHVEAARELRLHEMRGGARGGGAGTPGRSGKFPRAQAINPHHHAYTSGLLRKLLKG